MGAEFTSDMARETALVMPQLAAIFIAGMATDAGIELGWDGHGAAELDGLCDAFLRTRPSRKVKHSMVMAMGAYLGELIVRVSEGRWGYDADLREAVIETPDGLQGWPHTKVSKRFEQGERHSLFQYYRYAVHPSQRQAIASGWG